MVAGLRNLIIPEIGLSTDSTVSSLEYARIVQDAILCSRSGLKDLFKDISLVYKPKNILSGDFYFYQKKNDQIYLAVCDCTGHGISGALLSILGHNTLERSLAKYDTLPEIMKYLNENIINSFSKESGLTEMGMDMVLIKLDLDSLNLDFIGAKRPFWLFREGELQEFKTQRNSIGTDRSFNWISSSVKLKKGDRITLFTDGYVDQFGENGKKYGKKRLESSMRKYSFRQQNELLEELNNDMELYKGYGTVQTDDMLFISFDI